MTTQLFISFADKNIRLASGRWLFAKCHAMRFEWFALLAYKRLVFPADQAWTSVEDISALPNWKGRPHRHIAVNIGRYLQSETLQNAGVAISGDPWSGPYCLETSPVGIAFDIPRAEVPQRLHIRQREKVERRTMCEFTARYVRAQWLIYRGRLHSMSDQSSRLSESAFDILRGMIDETRYGPVLRLLSCLTATEVLFRMGRIKAARETLEDNRRLLRRVADQSLKAHFHLKVAWAIQRASSGTASNRATESALAKAGAYAEHSGDRAALGLLDHRTALYLTKRGKHSEAIDHLVRALEAHLITGNYHMVQVTCGDLGSIVHRLGPNYYQEARSWLLLSIIVSRWMGMGRDDAHGEMILGKIYAEQGQRFQSKWFLKRAERIARQAGNAINLADIKMVFGFWYQRFGTRRELVLTLSDAIRIYRNLYEFDFRQKEKYMSRKFSEVWGDVLEQVHQRRHGA